MSRPLLEVNDLKKHFVLHSGFLSGETTKVYAVDGVSFNIDKGETLSLVGEFGLRQVDGGALHPAIVRHYSWPSRARRQAH